MNGCIQGIINTCDILNDVFDDSHNFKVPLPPTYLAA